MKLGFTAENVFPGSAEGLVSILFFKGHYVFGLISLSVPGIFSASLGSGVFLYKMLYNKRIIGNIFNFFCISIGTTLRNNIQFISIFICFIPYVMKQFAVFFAAFCMNNIMNKEIGII